MGYEPHWFMLKLIEELDGVEGRTKLQKLIFLGEKELGLPEVFTFDKHHYGPYSWHLTEVIEDLVAGGYLREDIKIKGEHISYIYTPTKKMGKSQLDKIKIPPETISTLKKIKALPLSIILSYVYGKYLPERAILQ